MKITKRQLKRIIAESLGVDFINEQESGNDKNAIQKAINKVKNINVNNFNKVRTTNRKAVAGDEEAIKDLKRQQAKLQKRVDKGPGKTNISKNRYEEASSLLDQVDETLKSIEAKGVKVDQEPEISPAKEKETPKQTKAPETKVEKKPPEDTDWLTYKDETGYEYQLRNCVWFTKNTKTNKEFELGPASGGGSYHNTIVKLNNEFPNLVKDCNPAKEKKKTAPKPQKSEAGSDLLQKLYSYALGELRSTGLQKQFSDEQAQFDSGRNPAEDFRKSLAILANAEKAKDPSKTGNARDTLKNVLNHYKLNTGKNGLYQVYPSLTAGFSDQIDVETFFALVDDVMIQLVDIVGPQGTYQTSGEMWKQNLAKNSYTVAFETEINKTIAP